ncbi:MAG: Ig-like domain-containing protein, partial [Candidatus Bathyarchaeia archaeon]
NYEGAASGDDAEPLTPGEATVITILSSNSTQLGNSVYDNVIVYGINATIPTGTVRFEYRNGTGEWTLLSNTTLIPDTTNTSIATSLEVYLKFAGVWYFRAVYSGDKNYTSSASGDTAEQLIVLKADPEVKIVLSSESITLGESITATANVTGLKGDFPAPTGQVTFQVLPPGGNWISFGNLKNLTDGLATSDAYMPNKAGTWYFRAYYHGDDNYNDAYSQMEPLIVNKAPTITTTLLSKLNITKGESITDQATVLPQAGQTPNLPYPTGTVTFEIFMYTTNGSGYWISFGSSKTLMSGSAISDPYTPTVGDWYFRAVYSGDENYLPSQSGETEEHLRVNMVPGTVGTIIISSTSKSGRDPFLTNSTYSILNPSDKVNPQLSVGHTSMTIISSPLPEIQVEPVINVTILLQTTMVSNIPYQTIKVDLNFTYNGKNYFIGTTTFNANASNSNPPAIYYNQNISVLNPNNPFVDNSGIRVMPEGSILQLTITLITPQTRVDVFGGVEGTKIELF